MEVYPLIFSPILKRRVWGGARLRERFGKGVKDVRTDAGAGPIGESWEISDLPGEESVIANGLLAGKTLSDAIRLWGKDLIGGAALCRGRFPLLIKFLDAAEALSVQVHPKDEEWRMANSEQTWGGVATKPFGDPVVGHSESQSGHRKCFGSERADVKHEAWYVIEAKPGAVIYRGVREGVTRDELRAAIRKGSLPELLIQIPAKKGHAYFLPSGTIHALGGGVMVAEVQTPSDITYRLYDWDRVDLARGGPRELHIEEGLQHATLEPVAAEFERQEHVASVWTTVTSLVRCPAFTIERVRMVAGLEQEIPYAEMVIWIVLEGTGSIQWEKSQTLDFEPGMTVLLPARLKSGRVLTREPCMWLEVTTPVASSLSGYLRPDRSELASERPAEALVELRLPDKKP